MNTPSNGAQKANMRSAQKKTPVSEKKSGNEQISGKKLVQARLPFKILSGTPPTATVEGGASLDKSLDSLPKKRKLSYSDESDNPKKIGKSQSKENLIEADKDVSAAVSIETVIDLDDNDSNHSNELQSPKTPVVDLRNKKTRKNTPRSAGSSTTPKVQIKLPLSGKKKKRKVKRVSPTAPKNQVSDSSDVEFVSEASENPHKKAKLSNENEKDQDESEPDLPEADVVDLNKNQKIATSVSKSQNKCRSNSEAITETPQKHDALDESVKSSDTKLRKSISTADKKNKNKLPTTKNEEKAELSFEKKKISSSPISPKKVNSLNNSIPKKVHNLINLSTSKELDQEKSEPSSEKTHVPYNKAASNNAKSDNEDSVSPVKKRMSQRFIKKAVVEEKKEKNETSFEEKCSEPETISEKSSAADTSINNDSRKKLLTPKQVKLMEQRKNAREEKERKLQQLKEEKDRKLQEQREERERKIQQEKLQKQKEREEKELQRKKEREEKDEQRRREKEEKEEQRRKEKEDKERKRLAEIEAKNEEKRKKDEAKEEERRKKDDERRRKELEKEEEENKKKKAAQAFTKFFVTKAAKSAAEDEQESRDGAESVDSLAFRPFQVKGDMKLAPLARREFNERSREKLDSFLKGIENDKKRLYVCQLKSGKHTPLKDSKTNLKENNEEDVIIIENELETAAQAIDEARPMPIQRYKAKFYFFRENRRPPFYGTWRKKSTVITPRRPFATDKKFFDYEVDSDDEWEEEEPGESLNGSEDEKDESEDDDYEVDNEWFVPHGHLSDEELQNEDELGPDTSREAQKAKLKALQQEFAQEMKKKTEKIKPRLIGAIWEDENGNQPKLCPTIIWDSLCTRAMMFSEPLLVKEPESTDPEPITPPPEKQKRLELNDTLLSDLVRLVHGNRHSKVFLIKEYIEHVSNTCETIKSGECLAPTKAQIREKIDEISEWSVIDVINSKKKHKKKLCWIVSSDVLDKYSLNQLGLRNQWSYKLQPKYDKEINEPSVVNGPQEDKSDECKSENVAKPSEKEKKKTPNSGITKFAKVLTKEEKQNQIKASKTSISGSSKITEKNPQTQKTPKPLNSTSSPKTTPKPATKLVISSVKKPSSPASNNNTPVVKKRVALLMSVPPGQQFSPQTKNTLISNFLQKGKTTSTSSLQGKSDSPVTCMDVDEVVVLD